MSEQNDNSLYTTEQTPTISTGWDSPPTLAELRSDFESAKPSRDSQVAQIEIWNQYRKGTGSAGAKTQEGQSKVVPKLIKKQAEWRYPALSEPFLSIPDLFKVSPVSWEDQQGAIQNGLVLNNQFNTVIDRVAFIDEFVRDNVDNGTAVIRVGWDYQTQKAEREDPIYAYAVDASMMQAYQEMATVEEQNPVLLQNYPQELQDGYDIFKQTQTPYRLQQTGTQIVEYDKVIRNCPTVEMCNLSNLYVDPACAGDVNKAKFIIYSFETSSSELKASGLYQNLDKINVSNSSPITSENFVTNSDDPSYQPEGKARKRIVAHEYWGSWDIDGTGILRPIVATWVGNVLIRMEDNPYPDGKPPFVVTKYRPISKKLYGEPDAELLKDNQDIIGAVTRGMLDLLGKSANGQTGFTKGALDSTNKTRFSRGEDFEINPGQNAQTAIQQLKYPDIPVSAQYMLSLMNTDAESLTGVKAFSGAEGISGAGLGATAAGVRGALDAASKREMAILRRLSNGVVEIGRKILAMNALWLNEEEVVRVTEEQFIPVRRDDLAGNYDINLTISTAEQDEAKAQELAMMIQTLGNNVDWSITQMILTEIARLRKMPELAHKLLNYQPQPDPMQQKMQELQMQLLQSEIQLNLSQANENGSKANLAATKIGTEQVKQGHVQSQTDKNNLEFLQSQNGVKHQQSMELEEAKGNTQLATEALKQSGNMAAIGQQHNMNLLQNHAKIDMTHKSALQQMRAQASLAPKQPAGSSK